MRQDRTGQGERRWQPVARGRAGRVGGWVRSVRLSPSSHPRFDSFREPLQELGLGAGLVSVQVTRPSFQ